MYGNDYYEKSVGIIVEPIQSGCHGTVVPIATGRPETNDRRNRVPGCWPARLTGILSFACMAAIRTWATIMRVRASSCDRPSPIPACSDCRRPRPANSSRGISRCKAPLLMRQRPIESGWRAAANARGPDRRVYPWGDGAPDGRCDAGSAGYPQFNRYDYPQGQSSTWPGTRGNCWASLGDIAPSDIANQIAIYGRLDYIGANLVAHTVPIYSPLGVANCFPIGTANHLITFRAVYPITSAYDAILPR